MGQGGFSVMQGGNFWQGAIGGFLGSFSGSLGLGAGMNKLGMIGISTATSGVGVAIAGGNLKDIFYGMVSGATVATLNHLLHYVVIHGKDMSRNIKAAARYMVGQSKTLKTPAQGDASTHEVAAAILKDGNVVVFPEQNNSENHAEVNILKDNDKLYVVLNGKGHEVAYVMHTHPGSPLNEFGNPNPLGVSDNDKNLYRNKSGKFFKRTQYFIMDGNVYSVDVSSAISIQHPQLEFSLNK